MKKCDGFQCGYNDSGICAKFGPNTDCTIRTCLYSCQMCINKCKNQKSRINKTGNTGKQGV